MHHRKLRSTLAVLAATAGVTVFGDKTFGTREPKVAMADTSANAQSVAVRLGAEIA